jgi:methionyl-tRNA formyltransferase
LESIYNKYRGFYLRPKIYFVHEGKRIIIEELELDETIYHQEKDCPLISNEHSITKAVKTLKLKPEGKKPMTRDSFKNGYLK